LLRDADAIVQGVGGVARSSRPYGGRDGRLPHLRGCPRAGPGGRHLRQPDHPGHLQRAHQGESIHRPGGGTYGHV